MSSRNECRSRPQAGCQKVKYVRAKSPWPKPIQALLVSVSDEQPDDGLSDMIRIEVEWLQARTTDIVIAGVVCCTGQA